MKMMAYAAWDRTVRIISVLCFATSVLVAESVFSQSPDGGGNVPESTAAKVSAAAFQTLGSNVFVWGADFLALQPYAQISLESWERNLQGNWQWDDSLFFTNQILHPYQGSSYFNAARINGLSFWQSVPFVAAGSLTWEVFFENGLPSMNDFITTTLGGVAVGETAYRLSAALLVRKPEGYRGVLREVAAGIINPMQAANRLAFGRTFPEGSPGRPSFYSLDLVSGLAGSGEDARSVAGEVHALLGARFQYGDPYYGQDRYGPYEYFDFDFDVAVNVDNPTWLVLGKAVVYGRELYLGRESRAVVGVFQHFDYLENFVYKFAANGVGGGIQFSIPLGPRFSVEFGTHLSGIALGGVDSAYSQDLEGRAYSLGPGFSTKSSLSLSWRGAWAASFLANRYFFRTVSGADDRNYVGMLSASAEVFVTDELRIGSALQFYDRVSDADIDTASTFACRIYLVRAL